MNDFMPNMCHVILQISKTCCRMGHLFTNRQSQAILSRIMKKMASLQDRPSSDLASFKAKFRESKHVVVLTGAGVSAESGVPTFRSYHNLNFFQFSFTWRANQLPPNRMILSSFVPSINWLFCLEPLRGFLS